MDKDCPPSKDFKIFMLAAASAAKKLGLSEKEIYTQKIVGVRSPDHAEEFEFLFDLQWHIDDCLYCQDYLGSLSRSVIEEHERYEAAVKNNEIIRPHLEDSAPVFNAKQVSKNVSGLKN